MAKKTYSVKEVARCYRVCFLDKETGGLTQEGRVVMKDLQVMGRLEEDTFSECSLTMAMYSGCMRVANRVFRLVFTNEIEFEGTGEVVQLEDGDGFVNGNNELDMEI